MPSLPWDGWERGFFFFFFVVRGGGKLEEEGFFFFFLEGAEEREGLGEDGVWGWSVKGDFFVRVGEGRRRGLFCWGRKGKKNFFFFFLWQ